MGAVADPVSPTQARCGSQNPIHDHRKKAEMALANASFQTPADDIGAGILDGVITGLITLDPTENDEPTVLMETDDPFSLKVDWQLSGPLVWVTGGTWEVALYIDDIDGVGTTHGQLAAATIPVNVVSNPQPYSVRFDVPANSVTPGVYQLVVTINHSPQGGPLGKLTEMVGFAESTPVKFTITSAESN